MRLLRLAGFLASSESDGWMSDRLEAMRGSLRQSQAGPSGEELVRNVSGSMIGGVEHLELVDLTGTGYESESQTLGRLGLMHGPLGEDLNTYSELAAYDRNLAQDADIASTEAAAGRELLAADRAAAVAAGRQPQPHGSLSDIGGGFGAAGLRELSRGVTHSYPEHPVTVAQAQAAAVDAARRAAEAESRSAAALARAGLAPDGKDLPSSLLFPPIRPVSSAQRAMAQ